MRKICTKETPCIKDGNNWQHPEAVCVDMDDDYDYYKCPICNTRFKETVSQ